MERNIKELTGMIEAYMPELQILNRTGNLLHLTETVKELLVSIVYVELADKAEDDYKLRLYLEYSAAGFLSMLIEWIIKPEPSLEEFAEFLTKVTLGDFRAIRTE